MAANPLEHVNDTGTWVFFESLGGGAEVHLPSFPVGFGHRFQITKFMIVELLAALAIVAIYVWPGKLAQRAREGQPPKGLFWNTFESLLTFIRDEVAKPYIGEHDGDKYVPFLWSQFLFVLFCNLMGLVPFLASPTASLAVTAALALCSFFVIHGGAVAKHGPLHYAQSYVPHTGLPLWASLPLIILIVSIEVFGHFIKAFVLAVRLFANMLGGHTVVAVILGFIVLAKNAGALFWPVTAASVVGVVALSFLELFVAFLQAYIFVFLTAIFLGGTLHPEH
ncbi:MAG: F0F1 ATP synthase subunit A [Gemmataceae bacterium]